MAWGRSCHSSPCACMRRDGAVLGIIGFHTCLRRRHCRANCHQNKFSISECLSESTARWMMLAERGAPSGPPHLARANRFWEYSIVIPPHSSFAARTANPSTLSACQHARVVGSMPGRDRTISLSTCLFSHQTVHITHLDCHSRTIQESGICQGTALFSY